MQRIINMISVLVIVFAAASFALGQETVGSLEISTKDSAGALVPGVAITVTSTEGTAGFRRTVTTDSSGFVRVPQVPPGMYLVSAAATGGFSESTATARVELGRASQVLVEMGVKATAQVDVTVSENTLDTTSSEISTSLSADRIQQLPKGNNFTSILKVVPGTRPEPLAGGFSIDGASGAENTFIIDGQEVTNYRNAGINSNYDVPFGLVQEVQVKSSGFNAEYGGATGGVINVVTKGGNNQFRGDIGTQFEPSRLQGDPRQQLQRYTSGATSSPSYTQTVEYFKAPKSSWLNEYPSINVSGPILKDKVFFFGSYSPTMLTQTVNTTFYTNAPAATRTVTARETYTYKQKNEYAFGRIDANPISNLRLTGTYLWNPLIQEGALPFGTAAIGSSLNCLNFGGSTGNLCGNELSRRQGGRQNSNNVTFQAVYTPTSNIVGTFRYSRGFLNEKLGNYFKIAGTTRYICSNGNTPVVPGVSGANWSPDACTQGNNDAANDYSEKDVSVRTNYEGDVSFLFSGAGRHELKGGYAHQTIYNDLKRNDTTRVYLQYGVPIVNDLNWPGSIALSAGPICALDPTTRTPIVTAGCVLGHGALYRYSERGEGSNLNQAFYAQDKWQPFPRLTLNLGVRIEKEALPSFNGYDAPFSFGWGDKVAPRLGASYDLFGDGKTKIYGSYGKFYDRLKFKMAEGSFGGNFYRVDFFDILPTSGQFRTAFTVPTIHGNYTDPIAGDCAATGFIGSGLSRCQLDFRVPSNVPGVNIEDAGGIDTNLKPYSQREMTFGFERELSKNFVLTARYTNKKLLETIEDAGAFSSTGSEIYITGNPGRGLHADFLEQFGYDAHATARRNYSAFEIQLDRRLSNNFYFNVNYTYSQLRGNYSGLANSDEAGRSDPGVNRSFDLPHIGFTAAGGSDYGPLATDRPHVVNAYGGYQLAWSGTNTTDFGAFQTFQSGLPQSTLISFIVPIFLNGRNDMGRTPMFSQTDFTVTHRYKFGRDGRFGVAVNLNVTNLFDQDTTIGRYSTLSNVSLGGFSSALGYGCASPNYPCLINKFNSGELSAKINSNLNTILNAKDARYGMDNAFQGPRGVRFGFKFTF